MDKDLRGKRHITLVRQSSIADWTNSTEAQLQWMHAEGKTRGMTLADEIVLIGVTEFIPGNRKDLDALFEHKP